MSLIRTAVIISVVIMLLPTDEKRQAEVAGVAGAAVERTLTFCERNPGSCAAGREIWSTFLRKAEFGMELTSRLVREQMSRPAEPRASRSPEDYRGPDPRSLDARSTEVWSDPRNAPREPIPAAPQAPYRGSLTRTDVAPQWRGGPPDRIAR